jgi:hypothetical protein
MDNKKSYVKQSTIFFAPYNFLTFFIGVCVHVVLSRNVATCTVLMKYSFSLYQSSDVWENPPDGSSSCAVQQKTLKHSSKRTALMNILFLGHKNKPYLGSRAQCTFLRGGGHRDDGSWTGIIKCRRHLLSTDVDNKCLLHPNAVISVRSKVCIRPEDG